MTQRVGDGSANGTAASSASSGLFGGSTRAVFLDRHEAFPNSTASAIGRNGPTATSMASSHGTPGTSHAFYAPSSASSAASSASAPSSSGYGMALPSFPVLQPDHPREVALYPPPRTSATASITQTPAPVATTASTSGAPVSLAGYYGTNAPTSSAPAPAPASGEFKSMSFYSEGGPSQPYAIQPSTSSPGVSPHQSARTPPPTKAESFNSRAKRPHGGANLTINTTPGALSFATANGHDSPPKKHKVSRERQLKINAASRRCRKRQKLELQFLRVHVVELQNMLQNECIQWRQQLQQQQQQQQQNQPEVKSESKNSNDTRLARLTRFLNESIKKLDEMSPGTRSAVISSAPSSPVSPTSSSLPPSSTTSPVHESSNDASAVAPTFSAEAADETAPPLAVESGNHPKEHQEDQDEALSSDELRRGTDLSDSKKTSLLEIAQFIKRNVSLESRACSPEVISSLPIDLDGWQLRLSITEKHFTSHSTKFFPFDFQDLYDFCWEMNVSKYTSVQQDKEHYRIVTPLADDVAHVFSKTVGMWSSSVHGVPSISYKSVICRLREQDPKDKDKMKGNAKPRALILQQSVLDQEDLHDPDTIPWLFKRWVSFAPHEKDGVQGTLVEAFRTASYATGRLIYKENRRYDEFCEHLIRRYAECNALLETMMARDARFRSELEQTSRPLGEDQISERIVKDILLF